MVKALHATVDGKPTETLTNISTTLARQNLSVPEFISTGARFPKIVQLSTSRRSNPASLPGTYRLRHQEERAPVTRGLHHFPTKAIDMPRQCRRGTHR